VVTCKVARAVMRGRYSDARATTKPKEALL